MKVEDYTEVIPGIHGGVASVRMGVLGEDVLRGRNISTTTIGDLQQMAKAHIAVVLRFRGSLSLKVPVTVETLTGARTGSGGGGGLRVKRSCVLLDLLIDDQCTAQEFQTEFDEALSQMVVRSGTEMALSSSWRRDSDTVAAAVAAGEVKAEEAKVSRNF
jgi:hypothetical protein